jgi:hypothetical protein
MPGTALGTARLAGNQTAHIIGTFPSTSQQFTASAGWLLDIFKCFMFEINILPCFQ